MGRSTSNGRLGRGNKTQPKVLQHNFEGLQHNYVQAGGKQRKYVSRRLNNNQSTSESTATPSDGANNNA